MIKDQRPAKSDIDISVKESRWCSVLNQSQLEIPGIHVFFWSQSVYRVEIGWIDNNNLL